MKAAHAVALIGLGMASRPHARSLLELASEGRVEVAAAWSPSDARRQRFHAEWGLPVVDSLSAIVDDPAIRSVVLITPPDARRELVRDMARAGKHILMEKPLERSLAAASELVAIAERADIRFGVVLQQRFRDASLALADRVHEGALGELVCVQVAVPWWREQAYYDEPGRGTLSRDGGGVLISQAIHTLDLMLSLVGPVEAVMAMATTTKLHSMECEDFVAGSIRFASGVTGALTATTAQYPGATESIVLAGTLGCATLSGAELTIDYRNGGREVVGEPSGSGGGADPMDFPHHWHRRLIENFLDAVESDAEPAIPAREALAVHALIEALLRSSREGRLVRPAVQDEPVSRV